MGFINDIYTEEQTTPTITDRYHIPTAYSYWLEGRADNPAVFYMFGRKEALGGGYTIAAGLEGVIDIVKRWQNYGLSSEDLSFLATQKSIDGQQLYSPDFLAYLKSMEFKLKIDAAPEGMPFFPQEPVLRVEGPLAQVKILESVALCLVNGHSAYATHATRLTDVLEKKMENGSPTGEASVQGLRRGPGLGAALEASRSLGLGGYKSTSTGTAAEMFGQRFTGTMDHAWVMSHPKELGSIPMKELFQMEREGRIEELQEALKNDAFRSYAFANPQTATLLVDTYDPVQGLENAITVIKELREMGLGQQYGVRFDSGDIVQYSKRALRRYAEEGFIADLSKKEVQAMSDAELLKHAHKCSAFCSAADGIDEYTAQEMREAGAFFKFWGIGTAGSHVPPVGLVYKASSIYMGVLDGRPLPENAEMTPVMKVASNAPVKSSNPGKINSRRFYDADGQLSHVVVYDENLGLHAKSEIVNLRDFSDQKVNTDYSACADLLVPVFDAEGRYVYQEPPKKPSYPGSSYMVTDLEGIAHQIKQHLDTLPDNVRIVARPRDEIVKDLLIKAYKKAKKDGQSALSLSLADIEDVLPPETGHIPVFLDMNLFNQRRACEKKHLAKANTAGVSAYVERFEADGPTNDKTPPQKHKELKP